MQKQKQQIKGVDLIMLQDVNYRYSENQEMNETIQYWMEKVHQKKLEEYENRVQKFKNKYLPEKRQLTVPEPFHLYANEQIYEHRRQTKAKEYNKKNESFLNMYQKPPHIPLYDNPTCGQIINSKFQNHYFKEMTNVQIEQIQKISDQIHDKRYQFKENNSCGQNYKNTMQSDKIFPDFKSYAPNIKTEDKSEIINQPQKKQIQVYEKDVNLIYRLISNKQNSKNIKFTTAERFKSQPPWKQQQTSPLSYQKIQYGKYAKQCID